MSTRDETCAPNAYAATGEVARSYAPLAGQIETEVAIVGGGFTGLSTALHLAEGGTDVVVLDAFQPGWGASGRNGGQLNPGLKFDPSEIEAMFGAVRGKALVDFAWAGPDFTMALIRRLGIACEARQNGTLRATASSKPIAALTRTADQCAQRGMPVRLIDGQDVAEMTGTDRYKAAMFDARGGDLNPLKFARGLAAAASGAGAVIFGDSHVISLEKRSQTWIVTTAKGTVRARRVLLATNGYTDGLWPKLKQTVVPVFSAIAATAPLPDRMSRDIMRSRSVLYESGNITVYYRVDAENRLLMGGRGPMRPISDPAVLPNLTTYAKRLWPALSDIQWTHAWNGRVAMTEDHLPHIHELAEGLLACLGYNGRGVALSTSLGAALAAALKTGALDGLPIPATPVKPIAFHGFWPLGVKAAIYKGRLKDAFDL